MSTLLRTSRLLLFRSSSSVISTTTNAFDRLPIRGFSSSSFCTSAAPPNYAPPSFPAASQSAPSLASSPAGSSSNRGKDNGMHVTSHNKRAVTKKFVDTQDFHENIHAFVAENRDKLDTSCTVTLLLAAKKKNVSLEETTISDLLSIWENTRDDHKGLNATTMIFQGLSRVKGAKDHTLAPRMLRCLADTVASCSETFQGRNIGQCFYALRHLDAGQNEEEVVRVLVALTAKVEDSTAVLTSQEIGNALLGLKTISCDRREVRTLLAALTAKVQDSTAEINAQQIWDALCGMQNMDSGVSEVRALLSALTVKLQNSRCFLDAQVLSYALDELKSMNMDHAEVLTLREELIKAKTEDIRFEMKKFIESPEFKPVKVREFVAENRDRIEINNIATLLFAANKKNVSLEETTISDLLSIWEKKLDNQRGNIATTMIFQGLSRVKGTKDLTLAPRMLRCLADTVASCSEMFESRNIGQCFYALRHLDAGQNEEEVVRVLVALTAKVENSTDVLSAQAVGNALLGLKTISCDRREVRTLLAALTAKVQDSTAEMNAQEIGNALYGMQNMTSEVSEVRALLSALTVKLQNSSSELDAQAIDNAVYGLKGMTSDSPEVRALLSALSAKVKSSKAMLNSREIGKALCGLQNMTSEHLEVRALLSALTAKVESSTAMLTSREIGKALCGMQNMTSEHMEVRALLSALTAKLESSTAMHSAQSIRYALFDLKKMNSDQPEVQALMTALNAKVTDSAEALNSIEFYSPVGSDSGSGGDIRSEMNKFIESPDFIMKLKVSAFVAENRDRLEINNIAKLLFTANKKNVDLEETAISDLLSIWEKKRDERLGNIATTMIFQGLSRVKGTKDHTLAPRMLRCLADTVASCSEMFEGRNIGQCFYALRHLDAGQNEEEVVRVLVALTAKVEDSTAVLTSQEIGNALLGLKTISCDRREVRTLLAALTAKVQDSTAEMNAQEIGNALYGMQNMDSGVSEVRALLSALTVKIQNSSEELQAQNIANAMYGLKGMTSDSPEVRALLSALSAKVESSTAILNAKHIGNALFGLQNMDSKPLEVRVLLSALAAKVHNSRSVLDAKYTINALFGLNRMSSDQSEVRAMLSVLAVKVKTVLTSSLYSSARHSLKGMNSDHPEVRALLAALTAAKAKGSTPLRVRTE